MNNEETADGCIAHGYPDCDCNTGISIPADKPRWHMFKDGRTFIMYGPQLDVLARAMKGGYENVTASGHYSYATNTIVDAKDGPVTFVDYRPSGRLYV